MHGEVSSNFHFLASRISLILIASAWQPCSRVLGSRFLRSIADPVHYPTRALPRRLGLMRSLPHVLLKLHTLLLFLLIAFQYNRIVWRHFKPLYIFSPWISSSYKSCLHPKHIHYSKHIPDLLTPFKNVKVKSTKLQPLIMISDKYPDKSNRALHNNISLWRYNWDCMFFQHYLTKVKRPLVIMVSGSLFISLGHSKWE